MRSLVLAAALVGPLLAAPVAPAPPEPPALALPIQCRVGVDCEIQNYVDRDPGPGAKDYRCGSRSYQGHNGIDFRLSTMRAQRQGVAVLAAAAGRVLRSRDGVADVSVRATGATAVEGRECGNGVVIGHAGGFETQYCHLAQGSIAVRPGQAVKAGEAIGRVGLSGQTEYPHLHFTMRQGQSLVDPFAYGAPEGACEAGRSLWLPELRDALAYQARSVLNIGFATRGVSMVEVDEEPDRPDDDAPAIVAYARAIGLKADDVQSLTLKGPDGAVLASNAAKGLPRDQAQSMLFAGVPRPVRGWTLGTYRAEYVVRRGGRTVLRREFELVL